MILPPCSASGALRRLSVHRHRLRRGAGDGRLRDFHQAGGAVLLQRPDRAQGDVHRHRHGHAAIFLATGLGLLDYNLVWVNPTYLWPGIVGGLIMGVGFIIGGFCPGTSLVAAATLKIDGILFALGAFFGIFLFGETVGLYEPFWNSSYMGRFTLMDLFNTETGVIVVAVVVMALAAFALGGAERVIGKKDKATRRAGAMARPAAPRAERGRAVHRPADQCRPLGDDGGRSSPSSTRARFTSTRQMLSWTNDPEDRQHPGGRAARRSTTSSTSRRAPRAL
ncbi:MAG: YeeE/YedE family protein [Chloroflexi bacterium]|nr:YeeE/YedE family protein [Chloroflexota bacterium]